VIDMKIIRVDKYLRRIEALLCGDYERKLRRMEVMTMATQAALDALVARIDTAVAGIRADIEALKAREPELDLSSLEARVAGLEGLDAEYPEAPETPDEPSPEPEPTDEGESEEPTA
jgi:hypothetical protein